MTDKTTDQHLAVLRQCLAKAEHAYTLLSAVECELGDLPAAVVGKAQPKAEEALRHTMWTTEIIRERIHAL